MSNVLWGIVALLLALLRVFLAALDQVGLSLPWFAVKMAGVHFGARSSYRGWPASLFGDAIARLPVALMVRSITVWARNQVLPALLNITVWVKHLCNLQGRGRVISQIVPPNHAYVPFATSIN